VEYNKPLTWPREGLLRPDQGQGQGKESQAWDAFPSQNEQAIFRPILAAAAAGVCEAAGGGPDLQEPRSGAAPGL
jgi:hypothetical protein